MSGIESLEFRVEVWDAGDNRLEELVALCANSIVAKGAYEAALKQNPGANLVARQRAGAGISLVTLAGRPSSPRYGSAAGISTPAGAVVLYAAISVF